MGVDCCVCCCCDEIFHLDDITRLYIKQVMNDEIYFCNWCLEAMVEGGKLECVDEGDIDEDIYPTYEIRKTVKLYVKHNKRFSPKK